MPVRHAPKHVLSQEAQRYDDERSESLRNAAQKGDPARGRYQIPEATLRRLKTAKNRQKRLAYTLARFGCIPWPVKIYKITSILCINPLTRKRK